MGSLLSSEKRNKPETHIYEPFMNKSHNLPTNLIEQIHHLAERNNALEEEISLLKRELAMQTARIDLSIQNKYNELFTTLSYYNDKNNEKIKIILQHWANFTKQLTVVTDRINLYKLIISFSVLNFEKNYNFDISSNCKK